MTDNGDPEYASLTSDFYKSLTSDLKSIALGVGANAASMAVGEPTGSFLSAFDTLKQIISAKGSISDYFFYRKLCVYLWGISDVDQASKIRFASREIQGKECKFTEKLLFLLDKVDILEKCKIFSNISRAMFFDQISKEMAFKLFHLTLNSALEDLRFLLNSFYKGSIDYSQSSHINSLICAGLMFADKTHIDGGSFLEKQPPLVISENFYADYTIYITLDGKSLITYGLNYDHDYIFQ